MTRDELFMLRAFELARIGLGEVSPNPCVGCVIVSNGKIIGEGWHRKYGGPHAEVNALNSVEDKNFLKEATVYVNLEPCSHFGQTPPCADLLIRHRVKKVVVANRDTNPLVGGKGILKLREAGVEVILGVLEKEGRELNKRFFTFMEKRRPYIILKWAQTADGFMARTNHDSKWISNEYARQIVHQWRSQEDAILVGRKTAELDNPRLTTRDWAGRSPIRIVSDRFLSLPESLHLFDGVHRTYRYNVLTSSDEKNLLFVRLDEADFFNQLVLDLFKLKVQSVIVEGGRQMLNLFIQSGLWDEARIFSSALSWGSGVDAPGIRGDLMYTEDIFGDRLKIFYRR